MTTVQNVEQLPIVGLVKDMTMPEAERRELARYVVACREAVRYAEIKPSDLFLHSTGRTVAEESQHWHYIAHVRYLALCRIRGWKVR